MTAQTLKRLVGVLAIAAAVWLAVTLTADGGDGPISATGEITQFFEGMDESSVTAVRFTGGGSSSSSYASRKNGW